jgi:ABC-2 type transport system ATP-binding protein
MVHTVLQTNGLTKKYGEFNALNNVSLTLKQGDIYGLIGRNGAGKTTFFKCIMGLVKATAGTIEIGNEKINLNKARQKMGF